MKNIIENEVGAILTDILDDYKKDARLIRWISTTSRIKPKLWTFLTVCFPLFIRDFPR